jgi:hypothetical protein
MGDQRIFGAATTASAPSMAAMASASASARTVAA